MQQLPEQTVRLLSSAQVITSVLNAVKELVENALDARADSVEVKLDNFGLDRIEVRDNGVGISSQDVPLMGQRHFTSKLRAFSDLTSVTSYGFRGEALASLCAVAEVSVTTKREDDSISRVYTLDHSGFVTTSKPSHLGNGTTVTAAHLFKTVPVRRQYYSSSTRKKEELKRVEDLLMCYGYINHGVRFALSHNKKLVWQKSIVASFKVALLNTVGSSVMNQMEYVEQHDDDTGVTVSGFLPKAGSDLQLVGRFHSNDRCWIYINKRPVHFKEAERLLKQSFLQRHKEGVATIRYLTACLQFALPIETVDVNLEPDKRKVLLQNKDAVLTILSHVLTDFYKKDCGKAEPGSEPSGTDALPENVSDDRMHREAGMEEKSAIILDVENSLRRKENNEENNDSGTEEQPKSCSETGEEPIFPLDDDGIFMESQVTVQEKDRRETAPEKPDSQIIGENEGKLTHNDQNSGSECQRDSDSIVISQGECVKTGSGAVDFEGRICEKSRDSTLSDMIDEVISTNDWSKGIGFGSRSKPVAPVTLLVPSNEGNFESESTAGKDGEGLTNHERVIPPNQQSNDSNRQDGFSEKKDDVADCETSVKDLGPPLPSLSDGISVQEFEKNQLPEAPGRDLKNVDDVVSEEPVTKGNLPEQDHDQILTTLAGGNSNTVELSEKRKAEKSITNGIRDHVPPIRRSSFDLVHGAPVKRPESAFSHFMNEYAPKVSECIPRMEKDSLEILLKETWKEFPQDKRLEYQGRAEKDQERYKKRLFGSSTSDRQFQQRDGTANPTKRKKIEKRPPLSANQALIDQMLAMHEQKHAAVAKQEKLPLATKEVSFSVSCLRKFNERQVNRKNEEDDVRLICELLPQRYWIILQESRLLLFNHFRAEEVLLFKKLMDSHSLPATDLEVPIVLSESMVGSQMNWLSLLGLKCNPSNGTNISSYADERITSNGFKLHRIIDQERKSIQLQIVGMSNSIPCYSLADLNEILEKISESPAVTLSNCRPLKVENYLKSEAVRIARNKPEILSRGDAMDLIRSLKEVADESVMCLHDQPVFHDLGSLGKQRRTVVS